jgi:hypothetical protein
LRAEPHCFLAKKLELTAPDFRRGVLSDRRSSSPAWTSLRNHRPQPCQHDLHDQAFRPLSLFRSSGTGAALVHDLNVEMPCGKHDNQKRALWLPEAVKNSKVTFKEKSCVCSRQLLGSASLPGGSAHALSRRRGRALTKSNQLENVSQSAWASRSSRPPISPSGFVTFLPFAMFPQNEGLRRRGPRRLFRQGQTPRLEGEALARRS